MKFLCRVGIRGAGRRKKKDGDEAVLLSTFNQLLVALEPIVRLLK